jgi:hypothetical protein
MMAMEGGKLLKKAGETPKKTPVHHPVHHTQQSQQ